MTEPKQDRQLFLRFGASTQCCGGGCKKEEEEQTAAEPLQVDQSYKEACEELLEED